MTCALKNTVPGTYYIAHCIASTIHVHTGQSLPFMGTCAVIWSLMYRVICIYPFVVIHMYVVCVCVHVHVCVHVCVCGVCVCTPAI